MACKEEVKKKIPSEWIAMLVLQTVTAWMATDVHTYGELNSKMDAKIKIGQTQ